jgi:uncharacterized protein YdhG (YjbR/CyaY superfamily)
MSAPDATVAQYLAELPDDRREAIATVRATILANLPDGMEDAVEWGMLTYQVPMERSGPTYNGKPLMYAALASHKRHMALYLTDVYIDEARLERYRSTGKRLDMGKSCVRFRSLDDLPLDLVGETIRATTVDDFLARAARSRRSR